MTLAWASGAGLGAEAALAVEHMGVGAAGLRMMEMVGVRCEVNGGIARAAVARAIRYGSCVVPAKHTIDVCPCVWLWLREFQARLNARRRAEAGAGLCYGVGNNTAGAHGWRRQIDEHRHS